METEMETKLTTRLHSQQGVRDEDEDEDEEDMQMATAAALPFLTTTQQHQTPATPQQ
jgi:hypothetical protein